MIAAEIVITISDVEYRALLWRRTRVLRMLQREPNRVDPVEALLATVWPGELLLAESLRQAAVERHSA